MSGFDGRISFEGDKDRGKQLLGTAIKFAAQQRENKNILGQTSSTKAYDLGGGAYCIVVDLGHMRAMHIVAPTSEPITYVPPEFPVPEGVSGPGVYDVLSGHVDDARIVEKTITDAKGKKQTIKVILNFKPTKRTEKRHPSDQYRRQRLAVTENSTFLVPTPEPVEWSEHAHCKPSQYTGLMREVVQVVMGLGKIMRPTAEEALHLPPLPPVGKALIGDAVIRMVSAFGLYGHEAVFTPRVDFDYRAPKTHGVTFDRDGVPWVIEIGMRGIHAMRLYMDPVSMTKEGRARWLKVSPELEGFFSRFPGIPLGIALPVQELFDKYKRAGEVVQLMSNVDMRTFTSKNPMSSDTGWAFSPSGQQAHNTCWDWGLDMIKKGFHYSISINLVNERFAPWTPARSTLAARFTTIYEVNKCRRMKEDDAKQILRVYEQDVEEGDKAFDKFVVKPTLNGSAGMALQKTGVLYHNFRLDSSPQIKFPETVIGGVLSFDFTSADGPGGRHTAHRVNCNTPMYACYINGGLEVVNYAYNNMTSPTPSGGGVESTQGECQMGGDWTVTETGPTTNVVYGNFYSNRWDFRAEMPSGGEVTTTKCTASKYGAWMNWKQEFFFSTAFYSWTEVGFFTDRVWVRQNSSSYRRDSVAIPLNDRGAYYFAKADMIPNGVKGTSGSPIIFRAKKTYEWQVRHPVFAWFGGSFSCTDHIDKGPWDCVCRLLCIVVDENLCAEDDLGGEFYMQCCGSEPGTYTWEYPPFNPAKPPSSYSTGEIADPGHADAEVYFVNDTPYGEQVLKRTKNTYEEGPGIDLWWWKFSPSQDGAIASIAAVSSALDSKVSNVNNDFDAGVTNIGGPEYMFAGARSCYTGVIE